MPVPPEARELLKQKGIVGVSDPENVVRIYVETEEALAELPETIAGMSVVGVVSGRFYALRTRTDKWRPMPGGVSIGEINITAGTSGCVVVDNITGRKLILSNNHVLANCNRARAGSPILQPAPYDGGRYPDDMIGRLYRYVEIKEPPYTNLVDAAVAVPLDENDVTDEILGIGKLTGIADVSEGDTVRKSGRTTGVTEAKVFDTSATVKVYGYPWGYSIFEDQIITYAMAMGGDSGSAVVDNRNRAVGLLFAGSEKFTVVNKIQHVLDLLYVDLLYVSIPEHEEYVRAGINIMPLLFAGGLYYIYRKLRGG